MRSVNILAGLALTIAALGVSPAQAASKKTQAARPASRPAPETVYVAERPAPAPVEREYAPPEPRRSESVSFGSTRDYSQAFGFSMGFYSTEVIGGATPYVKLSWDLYPSAENYWFAFGLGGGPIQSGFAHQVVGRAQWFENPVLATLDATVGYTFSGLARGGGRNAGLFPYVLAGIASVYQGGSPNIGGVLGFGNRMDLPWVKDTRWVLNYGMRDQMYAQKSGNYQALTQNFALLIGVQKYY